MLPFASPLVGRQAQAARLAYTGRNPTGTLAALGVQVGDLLVIGQAVDGYKADAPPISAGGAWVYIINGGQGGSIYYRFVTQADLGGRVRAGDAGDFYLVVYRGARSVGVRNLTGGGTTSPGTFTISGVKKAPRHAGFVFAMSAPLYYTYAPTGPAAWQQRFHETAQANVGLWDRLYPDNPLYVDQTPFSLTQSGGSATQFVLMELIR